MIEGYLAPGSHIHDPLNMILHPIQRPGLSRECHVRVAKLTEWVGRRLEGRKQVDYAVASDPLQAPAFLFNRSSTPSVLYREEVGGAAVRR